LISLLVANSIIFANIIALMAISATLALSRTNVPNFAVATFGTIGIYISFTCIKLLGLGLYQSLIFCFIGGGIVGIIVYQLLIKPLRNRGATREEIMIATLGLDILLIALLNIYADYLTRNFKLMARDFTLSAYDFTVAGLSGAFIMSTITFITIMISLHLIFTRTSVGIAMKAIGEDPLLAECQGINTERLCVITWFIAGALPAVAGGFIPITIYDAALGGYIIGISQTLFISHLADIVGSWILSYGFFIALLIMIITVFTFPRGLYGLPWNRIIEKLRIQLYRGGEG